MEQKLHKHLIFHSKELEKILGILKDAGDYPRIIGGAVRDALLGKVQGDIDIATTLKPDDVICAFMNHNIQVIPTGIKFGTVTVVLNDETFEITSLRKDIKCDGRHALVEFTDSFELDSQRRDFTINALSYCPLDNMIYDYHDGLNDLYNKVVRFIGLPSERIEEDYLRILRFFRFSAYYADDLDEDSFAACIKHKKQLYKLPRERINQEIHKLVVSENAKNILVVMKDCGIDVFPDIDLCFTYFDDLYPVSKEYSITPNISIIYALLFMHNDITKLVQNLRSLLFSKKMVRNISDIISTCLSPNIVTNIKEKWIDKYDIKQHLLFGIVVDAIDTKNSAALNHLISQKPFIFPVTSKDLMDLGYHGKELGNKLDSLKEKWIESDFAMTKNQLINMR